MGFHLVSEADGDTGLSLGSGGRTPRADVGHFAPRSFQQIPRPGHTTLFFTRSSKALHVVSFTNPSLRMNRERRRAWHFWSRRQGKGTRTLCMLWQASTSRGRNAPLPWSGSVRALRQGLALVHFSAQLKRILWDRGAFWVFRGCRGGV